MTKDDIFTALHELIGTCGHCGKRSCLGRRSHSVLPDMLTMDDLEHALKKGARAAKRRKQCAKRTAWISKAERGGDSGNSAEPMNRARESARDTDATGDGDGLGLAAVPGTVGAQTGDRSQSSAIGSASPSNVSIDEGADASDEEVRDVASAPGELEVEWKFDGSDGGHKYDVHGTSDCAFDCGSWAGPFRSGGPDGIDPFGACPKNTLGNSVAGAEPGASRPAAAPADQPAALVPGELCDIDDLPDCLIGGVHQPHCRHAGKPVTKGGNP